MICHKHPQSIQNPSYTWLTCSIEGPCMMFLCLLGPVCLFDQCFDMLELYIIDVVPYFNVFQIHFAGAAGVLGRGPRVGNWVWFLFVSQGSAKIGLVISRVERTFWYINYCKESIRELDKMHQLLEWFANASRTFENSLGPMSWSPVHQAVSMGMLSMEDDEIWWFWYIYIHIVWWGCMDPSHWLLKRFQRFVAWPAWPRRWRKPRICSSRRSHRSVRRVRVVRPRPKARWNEFLDSLNDIEWHWITICWFQYYMVFFFFYWVIYMDTNHQLSARVVPFVRLAQLGAGQNVPSDKWDGIGTELPRWCIVWSPAAMTDFVKTHTYITIII